MAETTKRPRRLHPRLKAGDVGVRRRREKEPVQREVFDVIIHCGPGRKNADTVAQYVATFLKANRESHQKEGVTINSLSDVAFAMGLMMNLRIEPREIATARTGFSTSEESAPMGETRGSASPSPSPEVPNG